MTTHAKSHLPGKPIRDAVPRVFTGGWSHRHPLPSTSQLHTLRGKAGDQHTAHCLSKPYRHREPCCQGTEERLLKPMFPDASQGPACKEAFLRSAGSHRLVVLIPFCTGHSLKLHVQQAFDQLEFYRRKRNPIPQHILSTS